MEIFITFKDHLHLGGEYYHDIETIRFEKGKILLEKTVIQELSADIIKEIKFAKQK